MKKYIIFDLDGTLINSEKNLRQIVFKYLAEKYEFDHEKFNYYCANSKGTGLLEILKTFFDFSDELAQKETKNIYEKINKSGKVGDFFEKVPEKILELKKSYKLFLSTGNSTKFAEENLKKGGIYDCFEYILGSEKISKSSEHIKIFKEISLDQEFEKYAVFVGDGEKDREIAFENSIDFIHIDENLENKFSDKYEIKSVADISNILNSNL